MVYSLKSDLQRKHSCKFLFEPRQGPLSLPQSANRAILPVQGRSKKFIKKVFCQKGGTTGRGAWYVGTTIQPSIFKAVFKKSVFAFFAMVETQREEGLSQWVTLGVQWA